MAQQLNRFGGSEAAARAVWLRSKTSESSPLAAPVRRRAVVQALVGAVAGGILFALGHQVLAYVAWSIAAVMLVSALLSPHGLHAKLVRGFQLLGLGIGKLLTWVLLVPVFFLFFTLFGRLMRRGRRDRMERWLERSGASYWKPREDGEATLADYERQF